MASFVEDLGDNKVKIEIEIDGKRFNDTMNKVYQKLKGNYNVPGFRRGKAPRVMIENHYGSTVFFNDAFADIYPEVYEEAIKENSLEVVSDAENLKITKGDLDDVIAFSVEVYVKPEVKLGEYKGLKVKRLSTELTDEQVEEEVERIRNQNARWVEVERPAKEGDTVVMDYSGSIDGVKFDGGTAENQSLELGSGMFIPGFEEQLVGLKKGDEKDINVTFPEKYSSDLAGKDAVFAINLKEVKEKELPEMDDEFAQDVSEFETLDEYRADLKKKLEEEAENRARVGLENQLLERLAEGVTVDIPAPMVETEIDNNVQQLSYQLMYQGLKIEDYLGYADKTMEELREDYRNVAEEHVKMRLAVEELIEELEMTPSDEEAAKKMEELAEEAGKTVEEYKKTLGDREIDYFKDRLAMEKMFDYLVENAEIEQLKPGETIEEVLEEAAEEELKEEKAKAKKETKKEVKKEAEKETKKETEKEAEEK